MKKRDTEQKATSTSILKTIAGFQFVTKVPLDYMHLICLGVVKTFLLLLTTGGKNISLGSSIIEMINKRLNIFKKYVPSEFVRQPDSLAFLSQWKATQLRQFLLYIGYAAMLNIVPQHISKMFFRLCISIRILCSNQSELYDEAHSQILEFLKEFANIFGEEHLSHNFHNMSHLRDDVELHGPLDNFSAFRYENVMQQVLNDIRKPGKIIQQIYRRQKEREITPVDKSKKLVKSVENKDGPSVDGFFGVQYSKMQFKKFIINTRNDGDNCFLIDNHIMIVENIIQKNNRYYVVARKFKEKTKLSEDIFDSSVLKMFNCSKLSKKFKIFEIEKITAKFFRLPLHGDSFMVSPLLHFEKNDEY